MRDFGKYRDVRRIHRPRALAQKRSNPAWPAIAAAGATIALALALSVLASGLSFFSL